VVTRSPSVARGIVRSRPSQKGQGRRSGVITEG
jgi:hypothetical protein